MGAAKHTKVRHGPSPQKLGDKREEVIGNGHRADGDYVHRRPARREGGRCARERVGAAAEKRRPGRPRSRHERVPRRYHYPAPRQDAAAGVKRNGIEHRHVADRFTTGDVLLFERQVTRFYECLLTSHE